MNRIIAVLTLAAFFTIPSLQAGDGSNDKTTDKDKAGEKGCCPAKRGCCPKGGGGDKQCPAKEKAPEAK